MSREAATPEPEPAQLPQFFAPPLEGSFEGGEMGVFIQIADAFLDNELMCFLDPPDTYYTAEDLNMNDLWEFHEDHSPDIIISTPALIKDSKSIYLDEFLTICEQEGIKKE